MKTSLQSVRELVGPGWHWGEHNDKCLDDRKQQWESMERMCPTYLATGHQ